MSENVNDHLELRKSLIKAYEDRRFPEEAYDHLHGQEKDAAQACIVKLHNADLVDVVKAFSQLSNSDKRPSSFFDHRRAFEKLLPDLNAPVLEVMACTVHLFQESGHPPSPSWVFSPFEDFCTRKKGRAEESFNHIANDFDRWSCLLPAILLAGSKHIPTTFHRRAITHTRNSHTELRRQALLSLGLLDWEEEGEILPEAISLLTDRAKTGTQDQEKACALKSAFQIRLKTRKHLATLNACIEVLLKDLEKHGCYVASEIFANHTDDIPPELWDPLVNSILAVDSSNNGTVSNIDVGIRHLLSRERIEAGIGILKRLLSKSATKEIFSNLGSSLNQIACSEPTRNQVISQFLLSGQEQLCLAAKTIVETINGPAVILEVPEEVIPKGGNNEPLYLARKALGYLFYHPVTAASIIVSLLRQSKGNEETEQLTDLLYNPLLINYSGEAREYLESLQEDPATAIPRINDVLSRHGIYQKDLKGVPELSEFHPTTKHRLAQMRHMLEMAERSYKEAESRSILAQLVQKSVILYGKSSVIYTKNSSGIESRSAINLNSHGVSFECPRMETIDPVDLDYMLRIFRHERFQK